MIQPTRIGRDLPPLDLRAKETFGLQEFTNGISGFLGILLGVNGIQAAKYRLPPCFGILLHDVANKRSRVLYRAQDTLLAIMHDELGVEGKIGHAETPKSGINLLINQELLGLEQ
jgi:hypothetical protein